MTTIRNATRADFIAFYGGAPPITVRAMVAVDEDGGLLAIGGHYMQGDVAVAFTDSVAHMSRRDMVRGARALMARLRRIKVDVVAVADDSCAVALRHFGFEPFGELYRLR